MTVPPRFAVPAVVLDDATAALPVLAAELEMVLAAEFDAVTLGRPLVVAAPEAALVAGALETTSEALSLAVELVAPEVTAAEQALNSGSVAAPPATRSTSRSRRRREQIGRVETAGGPLRAT